MKRQMKFIFTTLLAVCLVLPAFTAAAAEEEAVETTALQQGTEMLLEVLQDTSDEPSATARYVGDRATIVEEDGKTFAIVELKSSAWWQSLKTQTAQDGSFEDSDFEDAVVVSENEEEDTRTVKFEVQDLDLTLNAKIHIIVTGVPGLGEYDNSYDIRFKFSALDESDEEAVEVDEEDGQVVEEEDADESSSLADGEYTIDLSILHEEEDKASSMARYVEVPATLIVEDGTQTIQLNLLDNEQITSFQVEQADEFVEVEVVSVDEEANTRIVSFEVDDLGAIIPAKVQVFVAAQNYTGDHVVRLAFDVESISSGAEEVVEVTFEDIADSWAKTYIEELAAVGLIEGVTAQEFSPDTNITRAQFAVLISRVLGLTEEEVAYEGTFSDVEESLDWAVLHVEAAAKAGIVTGYDGKFDPFASITRQEMVTMTIRALEYKDESLTKEEAATIEFADQDSIQEYAVPYVQTGVALGMIDGQEVNGVLNFAPEDNATRAQAAKLMHHLLELVK